MSDRREWLPVRVVGNGCCVKRDDQYGYAKTFGIGPELLASCLAESVARVVVRYHLQVRAPFRSRGLQRQRATHAAAAA